MLIPNTFDVLAGSGIDSQHVTDVDERGADELRPSFNFARFRHVGCSVAFDSWVAIFDLELDMVWWRKSDGQTIIQNHLAIHAVFQVPPIVIDLCSGQLVLVEGLRIHEDESITLFVEVLYADVLDIRDLQFIATFVGSHQRGAANQILKFTFVKSVAFTWLAKIHFQHQVWFAVDLNLEAFTKIARFVRRHCSHPLTFLLINTIVSKMKILANQDSFVGPSSQSWQQYVKTAIRDVPTLLKSVGLKSPAGLGSDTHPDANTAKTFELFAPLPYVQRIRAGDWNDPLLRQILPVQAENDSTNGFSSDPNNELSATIAPGVLKKYRNRALLVIAKSCAINCRYCFRREFPYDSLPRTKAEWGDSLNLIEDDPTISEVILSGGEPLLNVDANLHWLVQEIASVPHVKRLRIHTRMPVVIPQRVTHEFLELLQNCRLPTTVVLHINHAQEIDDSVAFAATQLRTVPQLVLLNQSVLLRNVNDSFEALAALSWRLLDVGIIPYYLHQLDRVRGASHFEVARERGIQLLNELYRDLPGYAVPKYVCEEPGKFGKTMLFPNVE